MARKSAKKKAASSPASAAQNGDDRIIDAAMNLIGGRGWRNVTLADIAGESGLTLAQLYAAFPSKLAILDAFERRVNERTLEGGADGESPRDRLFELIMRRLDALNPHREAVRALLRDLPWDPSMALCAGPRFLNAMRWMGEAAGMETDGIGGIVRVNGLAAIYLSALRTWLDDDSEDRARTMAALDKALKRAEMLVRSLPGTPRWTTSERAG